MIQITLKAARVNAGLTQAEAAELIGVSALNIRNWELGNYKPTPERLPAIEEAYKIPIANIII
jgi:transcriptional regulator with XRE-family HTH domain